MKFFSLWNAKKQIKPTEEELRQHRCAFTGHRPEKLHRSASEVKVELRKAILQAIDDGFTTFLSGGARGIDLWAAEIVIELRKANPSLKLICVIPYDGFEARWSREWQLCYHRVILESDYVHIISNEYTHDVFQRRNMFLVRHSARLIAVYNGTYGGTQNTIGYGASFEVPIVIIPG